MTTRSHLRRAPLAARALMAVTSVVAMLACNGCTNSKENQAAMEAITAQIQSVLTQRPDVTRAEVSYQNSLDAAERADADIYVKPGSDYERIADDAVRLLWTSKLNPLGTINVSVTDTQVSTRGTVRRIIASSPQEIADLNNKYGQHPK